MTEIEVLQQIAGSLDFVSFCLFCTALAQTIIAIGALSRFNLTKPEE